MIDRERLRAEVQRVLDSYPAGTYAKDELLADVTHELRMVLERMGADPSTPLEVYVHEGELSVRIGMFWIS